MSGLANEALAIAVPVSEFDHIEDEINELVRNEDAEDAANELDGIARRLLATARAKAHEAATWRGVAQAEVERLKAPLADDEAFFVFSQLAGRSIESVGTERMQRLKDAIAHLIDRRTLRRRGEDS